MVLPSDFCKFFFSSAKITFTFVPEEQWEKNRADSANDEQGPQIVNK